MSKASVAAKDGGVPFGQCSVIEVEASAVVRVALLEARDRSRLVEPKRMFVGNVA